MKTALILLSIFLVSCDSCLSVDVDGNIDHHHYICVGEEEQVETYDDTDEEYEEDVCLTPEELIERLGE